MAYMRLGDLLIAAGVIRQDQLQAALSIQKQTRERLGDVLIQNSFITERNLIDALQIQLGVEFVDLTAVSIPVELAKYVPRNLARKFCVVPVKLVQDTLYLGNVKKCAVGKYPKSEKLGSAGQAACCACAHSRYLTGGSPSGLRV